MDAIVLKQIEEGIKNIEDTRASNNGNAFCYWAIKEILFDKFEENQENMIFPEQNDQGIDFFWIDEESKDIYLGQAKKNQTIDHGIVNDLLKSLDFLKNEENPRSPSLKEASTQFRMFIKDNPDSKITFLYVTLGGFSQTAQNAKDSHPKSKGMIKFYDGEEISKIYKENLISEAGKGIKEIEINVEKGKYYRFIEQKSKITDSLVCAVKASEIAKIFKNHGERIFSLNVRRGLGLRNKVNIGIGETLKNEKQKEYFYFYNNGISLVCEKIKETDKGEGIKLKLTNANIVNGGQTTRQIYDCREYLDNVYILINIFESKDKATITKIALYNNSQTAVTNADLLSNNDYLLALYKSCKFEKYYFERQKGLLNDEYKENSDKKSAFGKDWKTKIISPKELGQCYLAIMGLPALARGKSKLIFEVDGNDAKFDYVFKNMNASKAIFLWNIWLKMKDKIKELNEPTEITDIKYGKWLIFQYLGLCLKEKVLEKDKPKDPSNISQIPSKIFDGKKEEYEAHIKKIFDSLEVPSNKKEIISFFDMYFHEAFAAVREIFRQEQEKRKELAKAFSYNDFVKSESSRKNLFKEFYRAYAVDVRRQ